MNLSNFRISLDIHDMSSQVSISVKRGDTCRRICAVLTENGKPYVISDGCYAVFTAIKPDNTYLCNDCTVKDNVIIYDFDEQTVPVVGQVHCEIVLYNADNMRITSPRFDIIVDDVVYNGEEILSSNEGNALISAISEAKDVTSKLKQMLDDGVFANAIRGYADGEVVRVNDVSPIKHIVSVKVDHDTPTTVTVTRCGKNLLPYPYIHKENTVTSNGITFTDNGDGTITANGTATARTTYYFSRTDNRIYLTKGEQYMLSGCPSEGSSSTYVIQGTDGTLYPTDSGLGKPFTASGGGYYFYIIVYEGAVLNNVVFKPQLEVGGKKTPFDSYINPTIYTPNADGTVDGITTLSPTMTLLTDTEGAVINCEYNVDIKKYIDRISVAPGGVSSAAYISSVTLSASKWTGSDNLYSQVVSINGVTENSKVDLNPSVGQLAVFYQKDIAFVTENEDGVVTVYCIGQKPTADYTMQVTITEVIANE